MSCRQSLQKTADDGFTIWRTPYSETEQAGHRLHAGGEADMSHIIVAFSKRENAASIRNILVRSGMDVSAVCLTGAAVLQNADTLDEGIVVCGFRMPDIQ